MLVDNGCCCFFVCLFVCLFFFYYFYFLFTSLLTPRVIQNQITRVFIYKPRFKLEKKRISFVSFFNISGCFIYYRVFVLIWHELSPWLFYEYHWFFTLYSCSFLLKFNSNSYCILLTWKKKITHAVNVTIHCFFSTFQRN